VVAVILAADEMVHASSGGWLAQWAWLIVVVPFLAMISIVFFGKRLPREGGEIAVGAMGFVFVYAAALLILNITQGVLYEHSIQVAQIGSVSIEWGWVVDGLSTMMYFVVGILSFLVFTYALGYMKGDVRVTWFFAAFTFFAGSMLVLVSAPNLIQLIVGWEGVGLASYLLIGHYWEQKENSSAGMKAFYTNKIADIGLIIGAIVLGTAVGSFRYSAILDAAAANASVLAPVAVLGGVLLFIGAMGKSAQFPFHVWLPDAMAGPTPVSSLMHAATMVTAGVYLVARMYPLYAGMAANMRWLIVVIGVITLLIAGLLAIVQDDLKRVLAYSTVSQLGYMVAALGAGGYTAGLFHLWTHAFFKGLLFLTAGSVIHAVHSNNMSDMGGLRKKMPVTFWSFTSATLALVAIIPFAGFFSKDEILATLGQNGYTWAMWVGILGAFITAFYMGRAMFLTFFGTYKGEAHVHESPAVMAVPMAILGVASLIAGWVNIPGIYEGFHHWVTDRAITFPSFASEGFDVPLMVAGLGFAIAGLIIASFAYFRDEDTQVARDRVRVPVLWPFLEHKYYLDDLYLAALIDPIKGPIARAVNWSNSYVIDGIVNGAGVVARLVARFVYGDLDQKGIDLAVNTAAIVTGSAGGQVRRLQTGKVQQYAAMTVAGAVLLVIAIIVFT
jgi:NADH-quinone oxidoreductase subunit L